MKTINGTPKTLKELLQNTSSITAVPEQISPYGGYAGGRSDDCGYDGYNRGEIYAYIVLEYNE